MRRSEVLTNKVKWNEV